MNLMGYATGAASIENRWAHLEELTEPQLHVLIDNMPNVAVEGFDIDGRVQLWNRAAEKVFGFTELEAIGRTLDDLMLSKEAAAEFVAILKSVHERGEGIGPMQWDYHKRDGSTGTLLSTITPFPYPDGTPRFLCIDVDITENRKNELALRESEQRFRTLAETSLVGLWQITPEGHTIYINPALLRMLEVDSSEAMAAFTYHEFFTDVSLKRIEQELSQRPRGISSNYEVELVGKRGTHRNIIISGAPLFSEDGSLHSLIGTLTDITERKRAEQQLQKVLEEQRITLNELDHRVRNNLAALLTLIEVSEQGSTSVEEFAASIRGRVRAMSLVHNHLSHARWNALDMRQIAELVVPDDLRHALTVQGPDLVISPRNCTPLTMVLQEFTSNSIKYGAFSQKGGSVQLSWSVKRVDDKAERLTLHWVERGGPAIQDTRRMGTGLDLVRGLVESDLAGELELHFPRDGAEHMIRFPLEIPTNLPQ